MCTHIPPAVPELLYEPWRGAWKPARRAARRDPPTQPRYAFFGHVHKPLVRRMRIGGTECVNVGHFRATGAPFVLQW